MKLFKLPDLGEGLPDAEIQEWYVNEGDIVKVDQPLVSMETAKAVVDVPSPMNGKIVKFYGKPGDVIKTGEPLVGFELDEAEAPKDKGTVVGNLEESTDVTEDNFIIGSSSASSRTKSTPSARLLAKKLGVDISTLKGTGDLGVVTREDVLKESEQRSKPKEGFEPLRGVRRAMLTSMVQSHEEVVPVSIFDEADIQSWKEGEDITARLITAIVSAAKQEPALNAWFDKDTSSRRCFEEVNLGLAMDTEDGLFVPVIHNAESLSNHELRNIINQYKTSVRERDIAPEKLKGATITLSNFGKFAGRFASPIIVPPAVAILAVGRLYEAVVSSNGNIVAHRTLPLSLSFDHRAVTGGEATRFLGAVIESLQKT
ncbi:dihydrolipoamide acetyltransferase family protein [Legionella yabuuchiae]|uniref:dihydrolipoamide acetyltransferase family protein n=1 Tax=Legionella yabuuchiae TaxID=376727 RepID=UPI0010560753|nr:dihydrolipoamide acetyltransferase family protein [Legionella yabuuchiae]